MIPAKLANAMIGTGAVALAGVVAIVAATWATRPPPPTLVDGLPVLTVSEVLEARAEGGLREQPVAVRGYWSNDVVMHMCQPAESQPGVLEMWCGNDMAGITERDEPIFALTVNRGYVHAAGPYLVPWFPEALGRPLFDLPFINGERFPPVPIVVVGHYDDPRAEDCRPQARQLCLDRLVIDRIVEFDPDAVATPSP